MNERGLTEALRRIAEQAPPVRLPEDLWQRGRRLRRRRVVAATAVAVCVLALGVPLLGRSGDYPLVPAAAGPAVPAAVYLPLLGQATVHDSPSGPAAILVSGGGALRGTDAWGGFVGRSLLVSRDGKYRLVRTRSGSVAGSTLLLSSDGRYVAGDDTLEGVSWPDNAVAVLDLVTGKVRRYPAGLALAWTPDGRGLLIHESGKRRVSLLALDSGEQRTVLELGDLGPGGVRRAAFSPDGGRVAVQVGDTLHLVDVADSSRRRHVELGSRRMLAGGGAWLPDGRRLAILDMADCVTGCDDPALHPHAYQVRYLEADSGVEVPGPPLDDVVGVRPRLLGWQADGDAVVVEPGLNGGSGGVELIALRPGGGRSRLVDLPAEAQDVDVPRDLVGAGAFGGPSPSVVEGRLREVLAPVTPVVLALGPGLVVPLFLLLAVVVSMVSLIRRRRRRRLWSGP